MVDHRDPSKVSRRPEDLASATESTSATTGRGGVSGLRTGLAALDEVTTGLHPGKLFVVAARSSMGKTSLGTHIAAHVAIDLHRPVFFASLEMPAVGIVERIVCNRARLNIKRFRAGQLTRDEGVRYMSAMDAVGRAPLRVDDTPAATLMQVRTRARRMRAKHGDLAAVIVDYLQLMRSGANQSSRELEVADISRGLKALAMELGCPVIVLAQLNRGVETRSAKDKRPHLSDIRESGSIEQDADTVCLVYRDEVYDPGTRDPGVAELILAKHRNGPTCTVRTRYIAECAAFADLHGGSAASELADA